MSGASSPQRNLTVLLESSISYLEQAELYEMMSESFKILQPFYERNRDFKVSPLRDR